MAHAGDFEDAPLLLHAEAVGPPSPGPAAAAAAPPAAEQALWASGAKTEPINALRVEARSGSAAAALHAAATGMPWGVTAGLLLTDMVGIGALAMPSVFARLGWLISLLLLLLLSLGCGYLGVLFSRLAVAVPTAETMDQLGEAAGGKWGKRAVYAVFYTSVVADPVALHITCLLALQQVVPGLSTLAASGIVAIIMLPLSQIQNVHDIGWLALVATGCMFGAVATTLIKLLAITGDSLDATSLVPPHSTRTIEALIAVLNCFFAFGGQVNWYRYLTNMAHREEFKYAAELADSAMTIIYLLLGIVAYCKLGDSFDKSLPITSVLPPDVWKRLINLALLIRCLVAYTLNADVFTDLALKLGRPWLERVEGAFPRLGRAASWALVSTCCIATSFVVAWVVPEFDLVIAVIAAVGSVAAPYMLPALFGLALLPDLHPVERWLLKTIVPVSALLALAGLYASCYRLVEVLGG